MYIPHFIERFQEIFPNFSRTKNLVVFTILNREYYFFKNLFFLEFLAKNLETSQIISRSNQLYKQNLLPIHVIVKLPTLVPFFKHNFSLYCNGFIHSTSSNEINTQHIYMHLLFYFMHMLSVYKSSTVLTVHKRINLIRKCKK